jgi:hypothetical protein
MVLSWAWFTGARVDAAKKCAAEEKYQEMW